MAHVTHKLRNSWEGALAGGGDPATSPLYVFGPFLTLIVAAGVANITFGASIWLVVFTVVLVSAMYRRVMVWVTDGSGGSGLCEDEFGSWAVKVNAAITFIEYTLTFLVSMAALVTFVADRFPVLNRGFGQFTYRTFAAIILSILTGIVVNRGPRMAARVFGPATLAVLVLLWAMIGATIWKLGFQLPDLNFEAFKPDYIHFTLGGYARILALMTGIEIFANLVAAYHGEQASRSRKAFGSLVIIMGTTSLTMLIVGPAILALSDPSKTEVSVFTQTMDQLLPQPLPYIGTLVGILVLASAAAASAQGLQNLALGLRYRHYIPALFGQRNQYDVADKPVWLEVAICCICFLLIGTHEETYLAIYAAGVFVLLSMTGWAAVKRLLRQMREGAGASVLPAMLGAASAAVLTTVATLIIFEERFFEGAWTYLVLVPGIYIALDRFRSALGRPQSLEEHLGRFFTGQYLLPYQRQAGPQDDLRIERLLVPLDGSAQAENAISVAQLLAVRFSAEVDLVATVPAAARDRKPEGAASLPGEAAMEEYLNQIAESLRPSGIIVDIDVSRGEPSTQINTIANDSETDLIVMTTHGRSELERLFVSDVTERVVRTSRVPVLVIRPSEDWRSRRTQFRRLLVALDGSDASEQTLRYVRTFSRQFGSEALLLGVPEAESETAGLETYLKSVAQALEAIGIRSRYVVTGSGPARTIISVSEAEDSDLVVLSSGGRGGVGRNSPLGSVAYRVLHSSSRPLLLVPAISSPSGRAGKG